MNDATEKFEKAVLLAIFRLGGAASSAAIREELLETKVTVRDTDLFNVFPMLERNGFISAYADETKRRARFYKNYFELTEAGKEAVLSFI